MIYYDAACIHAALAKLALQDQGKPPAERQRLAQSDLERALELLDKARAAGEFKGMIHLDEVRRERLLDPLRSHPRFQLLMMDLAFPDDPFGTSNLPDSPTQDRATLVSTSREDSETSFRHAFARFTRRLRGCLSVTRPHAARSWRSP